MDSRNLVLIYNDGLTGSRIDIGDINTMRLLPRRTVWEKPSGKFTGKDGIEYFDIPEVAQALMSEMEHYGARNEITRIVGIFRGATIGLLDDNAHLVPKSVMQEHTTDTNRQGIWSYFNQFSEETEQALDAIMSPRKRYEIYGLPKNLPGSLIPGRTLVGLATDHPELMKQASRAALLPELFASLVAEPGFRQGTEPTYACCHTGLWSYKTKGWSELAAKIDAYCFDKTGKHLSGPENAPSDFINSWETIGVINQKLAKETHLESTVQILCGGHDSSMADVPVIALMKQRFGDDVEFVHFQAGSWGMPRLIGRKFEGLPEDGFDKSVMLQGDLYGNPVPTVLTPTGNEFAHYASTEPGKEGVFVKKLGHKLSNNVCIQDVMNVIISDLYVTPGAAAQGIGPFPYATGKIFDQQAILDDLSGTRAYVALNLETAICTVAGIELVAGKDPIKVVLSAGAAADPLYRTLVASLMPKSEVYCIMDNGKVVTETAAYAGLVLAKANADKVHPYQIEASELGKIEMINPEPQFKRFLHLYRQKFEKRCN